MRHSLAFTAFALSIAIAQAHCGSFDGSCEDTKTCEPGSAADGGDEGDDTAVVPAGCDPNAPLEDAAGAPCVVESFGVFVSAGGSDDAAGTKTAPLRSLTKALEVRGGKRLYVCAGTYAEAVVVTSKVAIFGGLDCAAWTPGGGETTVAPAEPGAVPIKVQEAQDVTLTSLTFRAPEGKNPGGNSVAAWVVRSAVKATKVSFIAGKGAEGAEGETGVTGVYTDTPGGAATGYVAMGASNGLLKECVCSTSTTTTKGASGGGAEAPGGTGAPAYGGVDPVDGKGGLTGGGCGPGTGHNGAPAPAQAGALAPTALGGLTGDQWIPAAGSEGKNAEPGQGGGGGAGGTGASGGGGGGCGGCGGTGGKGGSGGGASIAILSVSSSVALDASTVTTSTGGTGGAGGAGGAGAAGASQGSGAGSGCPGGIGGNGGTGGAGSGGAGGLSVGIAYSGQAPVLTSSKVTPSTPGNGGAGGVPLTNDGPNGKAGETYEIK